MMKQNGNRVSRRLMLAGLGALAIGLVGCSTLIEGGTELYKDYLGSRSWLRKASGVEVEHYAARTQEAGNLKGRFAGAGPCEYVIFIQRSGEVKVRCEVILPTTWNGRLVVLGCDGAGGDFARSAPKYLKDGSAVASCDGGMNCVRRRDWTADPIESGFRSPAAREVFMREALHLTVVGAKELVKARFGRAVEKTDFIGREAGAAQGVFLAELHPEDVDSLLLVSPTLDFWRAFAYELNVMTQIRTPAGVVIVRPFQCDAIVSAAQEIAQDPKAPMDPQKILTLAQQHAPSFTSRNTQERVCGMWYELLTGKSLSEKLQMKVDGVDPRVNLEPMRTAKPWHLGWFFGENETGHQLSPEKLAAVRTASKSLTPTGDLKTFAARGGKVSVVIESQNPFAPTTISQASTQSLKGLTPEVKTVAKHD